MSFCVLFVCTYVQHYRHRVATHLQLNISYHIILYHINSKLRWSDRPAPYCSCAQIFIAVYICCTEAIPAVVDAIVLTVHCVVCGPTVLTVHGVVCGPTVLTVHCVVCGPTVLTVHGVVCGPTVLTVHCVVCGPGLCPRCHLKPSATTSYGMIQKEANNFRSLLISN
jgi:hypothetical protein